MTTRFVRLLLLRFNSASAINAEFLYILYIYMFFKYVTKLLFCVCEMRGKLSSVVFVTSFRLECHEGCSEVIVVAQSHNCFRGA